MPELRAGDFYVKVSEGFGTLKKAGVFADDIPGLTRTQLVGEWCRHNHLGISASFAFGPYGVDGASVVARLDK